MASAFQLILQTFGFSAHLSLLGLLSASAAVRFSEGLGNGIISLNVQILLKSFRKELGNSTPPNYSLVRKRFWQGVTDEAWLPLRSALPLGAKKNKRVYDNNTSVIHYSWQLPSCASTKVVAINNRCHHFWWHHRSLFCSLSC